MDVQDPQREPPVGQANQKYPAGGGEGQANHESGGPEG